MKVLVACEFSGTVREAFWSCDLLPTDIPGQHLIADALVVAHAYKWDLMIAHPPCTDLAVSGARHFERKRKDGSQQRSIEFFINLAETPIRMKCIENPISIMSTLYRKPDQILQPWQFGHGETKSTCLWLTGLPLLKPTNIVDGRADRIHKMAPGPNRWKERSKTYQGIADAMASQWTKELRTLTPHSGDGE